ncbi:MAG: sulfatase family protein, partial [Planctomycetota bacterium]
ECGELENTVIVFTADHGEFLGSHGLLRKPSAHYDEVMQVPLLLSAPGHVASGRRVGGLVELVDLHPTLLSLLGIEINPGVQGLDWADALRDGEAIGREDVFADMHHLPRNRPMFSGGPYTAVLTLRTEAWKLNLYPCAGQACGQLFDLTNDPDETTNLYADPGHREKREEMVHRLLARTQENIDPLPICLSQW